MGVCRLLGKFLVFRDSKLNSCTIGNLHTLLITVTVAKGHKKRSLGDGEVRTDMMKAFRQIGMQ
jgi:hypothetical protein